MSFEQTPPHLIAAYAGMACQVGAPERPMDVLSGILLKPGTTEPGVVMAYPLPDRVEFERLVQEGMVIWDNLNPAIIGVVGRENPSALYSNRLLWSELHDIFDVSDKGVKLDSIIAQIVCRMEASQLGPRGPYILWDDDPDQFYLGRESLSPGLIGLGEGVPLPT